MREQEVGHVESWVESHTFIAARQSESGQGSNDPEGIVGIDRGDLALGRFRALDRELGARGRHNLLLFGASKLT